ncbi:autotransporter outer membrane beta-barrel domain-containing protein [Pseudomonas sp. TKO26]|uniref:autotransporter family protein n=1 Tax=unclassified Pseudomonas TaxID=196821 RepID=UPI000D899B77|nr:MULTISPECIES: autotransporter outer membrane beta-barrel domain-containing protein [unclassified Pseudomonas]PYY92236.1 autotransporter outer membrane beta-barrel domain-containing protein [Pseudomonas sp. TKO30]PYY94599.1 autotransporter outer membrane beta-barrel domain-containing protein [Pseudomonas sp. TKO29]PYY96472.1 autotransporter outer membrane beta-barrel domain-containing protein [Pseudomonas sp. TKO26]PYZ02064.1 autotransporter outer membrane beta-barrel domain-containing protei
MNISHLRRSLLALSVATATATVHAAPDLNYDLSAGPYVSSGDVFNNATFSGTSQNAGVKLTNVTLAGSLVNQGTINLTAANPSDIPSAIAMIRSSTVAGGLVNHGDITVSGTGAMGLDLYLTNITGEVSNNGNITVTGEDANGMMITSALARINNSGTITANGTDSAGIEIENARFTGQGTGTPIKTNVNNSGTISAEGVGIHFVSLDTSSGVNLFTITQTGGLIQGGTAAILANDNASPSYFYWQGGQVKGDLLGLSSVLVRGNAMFDGSTIRASFVDIDGGRLTLLRPQTTIVGDLDMDSETARLRLLLDNNTLPNTPILKVTGNTFFFPGSQIELQARSDDFRTSAQGTRYTLINSGTWEDPQNLSVVSSSALLEVKNFGIEGQDVKALVATRNDEVITQDLLGARGSRNAVNAIKPFKNTIMGQMDESDPVFQRFANAATREELAKLAETLIPDVHRGVINAATNSQNLVTSAINRRASKARSGLSSGDVLAEKGVWIQALSSDAEQDSRHGIDGYDANTNGIAVGADGKLNADTTVGLAYSYLTSDVKSDLGNKTDVSGHALTLYGNWARDNFFVDTSLMYGWNENESKRYIAGTRAKADYDSEIFGVNALAGYTFQLDKQWLLEPQIGARYANVSMDSYREKGSSVALNVGSQRYEIGEMGLGARLAAAFDVGVGSLEPEAKLMAWHDFIGDKVGTTSTFVLGGTPFTTRGATPARDSYELGVGANYRVGAWSVGGTYNYLTSNGFDADTFSANVRYDF